MKNKNINVQGIDIRVHHQGKAEYICLTDMAKNLEGEAGEYIKNWLRTAGTIQFLGVWEKVHNDNFNLVEFHQIKSEFVDTKIILSVKKWIERTQAIGITSKAGRYGGTYAHTDIAIQFATYLSPELYVHLIQEFQRLKVEEATEREDALEWNVKRFLSKVNYTVHTDAIKENLIPPRLTGKQTGGIYASEADVLNMAVFGMTAKEWRLHYPEAKGNIRDHATHLQLIVLANLEAVNAELIRVKMIQDERLEILNQAAIKQMNSLLTSPSLAQMGKLTKKLK
ncbi:MAG: KilA-N domain-containing protein [Saprospiraceae bacterium]